MAANKFTVQMEEKLIRLWDDKTLSVVDIAKEVGVGTSTATQKANRLGLPKRRSLEFSRWHRGDAVSATT